jgi:hypothetical protein
MNHTFNLVSKKNGAVKPCLFDTKNMDIICRSKRYEKKHGVHQDGALQNGALQNNVLGIIGKL